MTPPIPAFCPFVTLFIFNFAFFAIMKKPQNFIPPNTNARRI